MPAIRKDSSSQSTTTIGFVAMAKREVRSASGEAKVRCPNPAADTSAMEHEIDQQVYALYGLTTEEVAIVEGTAK